jgi:outer membrane receptor for ferrienterochelin and colicin
LVLVGDDELDEFVLERRMKTTTIDYLASIKLEQIGEKELHKAACCNLAESFETSPSVDVAFSDAISGTKQIQMLGLSGIYAQITIENMPGIRGVSSVDGLEFIPGTWIEGIQLNKGTGSVVNGFESGTGQINVELRKPDDTDKQYYNFYASQGGRLEANFHAGKTLNDHWSTAILLHARHNQQENDMNKDGFRDMPLGSHVFVMNRWKYKSDLVFWQGGLSGVYIDQKGGQIGFDPDKSDSISLSKWGMSNNIQKLSGFMKFGLVDKKRNNRSMAIQTNASVLNRNSQYGTKTYNPLEKTFYANYIFQDETDSGTHKIRTGLSFQLDDLQEEVDDVSYNLYESVVGVYGEYTFKHGYKFSSVFGARVDHSNIFGSWFTPRLHARYEIQENWIYRFSAGMGRRSPRIFGDNPGIFASNRMFVLPTLVNNLPYGLNQEITQNVGMSLTHNFRLDYRDGTISVDAYRTNFQQQVIVDFDQSTQAVSFYNLVGKSYANSLQVQVDYELAKRLDLRAAYRYYDVQLDYVSGRNSVPFVSNHRAFLNLAYETIKKWKFDATYNWQAAKRIPTTDGNPEAFRMAKASPSFGLLNAQVSKAWSNGLEIYFGVENMLNFRQENAIISASDPGSNYFDASLIWGPIFGRNSYIGFRYRI